MKSHRIIYIHVLIKYKIEYWYSLVCLCSKQRNTFKTQFCCVQQLIVNMFYHYFFQVKLGPKRHQDSGETSPNSKDQELDWKILEFKHEPLQLQMLYSIRFHAVSFNLTGNAKLPQQLKEKEELYGHNLPQNFQDSASTIITSYCAEPNVHEHMDGDSERALILCNSKNSERQGTMLEIMIGFANWLYY